MDELFIKFFKEYPSNIPISSIDECQNAANSGIKTKNGKTYYRMKVMDNNSESIWLRVWGSFNHDPELYSMWLAEVSSSESWGCSTSSYKMKRLNI